MSEHDIDKGTRNIPAIARNLDETQFGIICLTPENLNAAWLLFEAGALSKIQYDSRVWTFLYELELRVCVVKFPFGWMFFGGS